MIFLVVLFVILLLMLMILIPTLTFEINPYSKCDLLQQLELASDLESD